MTRFYKDKYFLFSLMVSVIILMSSNIGNDGREGIIGIAFDVDESKNGFVFDLEDTDGKIIHCFSKEKPSENNLYKIKGNYSDDNMILFVSSISAIRDS